MSDDIIKFCDGTVIINGGNPLPGCPKDWCEARAIQKQLNDGEDLDPTVHREGPRWCFDCGFKLDYDGPLVDVCSRFYPPKTHYGSTWDGTASIMLFDEVIAEKKFDCASLEELKQQVEAYVQSIANHFKAAIISENDRF